MLSLESLNDKISPGPSADNGVPLSGDWFYTDSAPAEIRTICRLVFYKIETPGMQHISDNLVTCANIEAVGKGAQKLATGALCLLKAYLIQGDPLVEEA